MVIYYFYLLGIHEPSGSDRPPNARYVRGASVWSAGDVERPQQRCSADVGGYIYGVGGDIALVGGYIYGVGGDIALVGGYIYGVGGYLVGV